MGKVPSLAQLEIKIQKKEVNKSVNNVELILIDFSILISFNNIELSQLKTTIEESNICENIYAVNSNFDIKIF